MIGIGWTAAASAEDHLPAFDVAKAATALQGEWPVKLWGADVHLSVHGDRVVTRFNGKDTPNVLRVLTPCSVALATEGGQGGAVVPYALVGGKLHWMEGYAVEHAGSTWMCFASEVYELEAQGACRSWRWSTDLATNVTTWTSGPASCTRSGTRVSVSQPYPHDFDQVEPGLFTVTPPKKK